MSLACLPPPPTPGALEAIYSSSDDEDDGPSEDEAPAWYYKPEMSNELVSNELVPPGEEEEARETARGTKRKSNEIPSRSKKLPRLEDPRGDEKIANLDEATRMFETLRVSAQLPPDWTLGFNKSVRNGGSTRHGPRTIWLSRLFVQHATRDQLKDVILHEIAHALTGPQEQDPKTSRRPVHGKVWRQNALRIGCSGNRCCHNFSAHLHKWFSVCHCPNERHTSHTRKNKCCKGCGERLVWQLDAERAALFAKANLF